MGASQAASRVLLEGDTLRIGFHGVGKAPYPEDLPAAAVRRSMAPLLLSMEREDAAAAELLSRAAG